MITDHCIRETHHQKLVVWYKCLSGRESHHSLRAFESLDSRILGRILITLCTKKMSLHSRISLRGIAKFNFLAVPMVAQVKKWEAGGATWGGLEVKMRAPGGAPPAKKSQFGECSP